MSATLTIPAHTIELPGFDALVESVAELGEKAHAVGQANADAIQDLLEEIKTLRAAHTKAVEHLAGVTPPTAAELSEPGRLAGYVSDSLGRTGRCVLPMGDIYTGRPIILSDLHGAFLGGVAPSYYKVGPMRSAWNRRDRNRTTRIVYQGDGPAIRLVNCSGFTLSGLGIDAPDGVLIDRGCGHITLDSLGFDDCGIAVQAGQTNRDNNAADVIVRHCVFRNCSTGFLVKHDQGLNYVFESLCTWERCGVAIHCERGGAVRVRDAATYGGGTLLRIDAGGANTMPCVIDGLRCDRAPGKDPLPVIVDASRATGGVLVRVRNVGVTGSAADAKDHVLFRLPAKPQTWQRIEADEVITAAAVRQGAHNVGPAF